MKNLKANTVGKPLPKTFGTFRVHSALAAAMVVPVSIIIRLVCICMYVHTYIYIYIYARTYVVLHTRIKYKF